MDNHKKSERPSKPLLNNTMSKKPENWDREADREAGRRDRFIDKKNKKKEQQLKKALEKETQLWTRQAEKE